jgi:hypothetical protein
LPLRWLSAGDTNESFVEPRGVGQEMVKGDWSASIGRELKAPEVRIDVLRQVDAALFDELKGRSSGHDLRHRRHSEDRSIGVDRPPGLQVSKPKSSDYRHLAPRNENEHGTWNVPLRHFRR